MLTEDYLMRMIRLATMAIARALGLKAAGLYQDALYVLDQMLEQLLGMRTDLMNNLEDASILSALTTQEGLDIDRLVVVADLIKEQSDIYASVNDKGESHWRYLRALNFYVEAVLRGGPQNMPSPDEKIADLLGKVEGQELPTQTLFSLYYYFDQAGQFEQAVITLDRLEKVLGPQDEISKERIAFYERLLDKQDSELNQGGTSRNEVRSRLDQLKE